MPVEKILKGRLAVCSTVDDIKPALRTLNYGNDGIFLIMGNAGCIPSTVALSQRGSKLVLANLHKATRRGG